MAQHVQVGGNDLHATVEQRLARSTLIALTRKLRSVKSEFVVSSLNWLTKRDSNSISALDQVREVHLVQQHIGFVEGHAVQHRLRAHILAEGRGGLQVHHLPHLVPAVSWISPDERIWIVSAPVLYMVLEWSNKRWTLAFGDSTKRLCPRDGSSTDRRTIDTDAN